MYTKKAILFIIHFLIISFGFSQFSMDKNGLLASAYSKEVSLFRAKSFVMNDVLGKTTGVVKFEINALVAASSGELTSLVYKCEDLNKSGLVLGFYSDRWNDQGFTFQSYSFKNLPEIKAIELLERLDSITSKYGKYMNSDLGANNIYFHFDDLDFLVYNTQFSTVLRVQWNGFDSVWEWAEVKKTQKRMLRKLD